MKENDYEIQKLQTERFRSKVRQQKGRSSIIHCTLNAYSLWLMAAWLKAEQQHHLRSGLGQEFLPFKKTDSNTHENDTLLSAVRHPANARRNHSLRPKSG
jgi:hypothetical protein